MKKIIEVKWHGFVIGGEKGYIRDLKKALEKLEKEIDQWTAENESNWHMNANDLQGKLRNEIVHYVKGNEVVFRP